MLTVSKSQRQGYNMQWSPKFNSSWNVFSIEFVLISCRIRLFGTNLGKDNFADKWFYI